MKRNQGFTIIEMMIAMTILAFISMAVYQNTTQSFVLRDNVEKDGDFYNAIRVALDIIGRDLTHIYSPQASAFPGTIGSAQAPQKNAQTGQMAAIPTEPATLFWGESINTDGVRPSRFQGDSEKMSLVINSHMRLFRESRESDFAKIEYFLDDDRMAPTNRPAKALVKTENPAAFDMEDRNDDLKQRYVILGNIKSIQFQYLDGEKDTWNKRWDTTGIDHKGKFPNVIEITVEVYMPGANLDNTFKINQRYKPELPL